MLRTSSVEETIVSTATPAGRGAVAVVRLSGPNAFAIAARHVTPWPLPARKAVLCTIRDVGQVLDHAIVVSYHKPSSFTGDDTVEITTHGGSLVPTSIVAALVSSGARQARPGEFTQRAVLNGKIDILQAEAIGDLIDAGSSMMQRLAIDQLDGGLSRRLVALREDLLQLEALIAYDVDFPEEDDGPIPRSRIEEATSHAVDGIKVLLSTSTTGEVIRDGALVVIAGPPNVGKSSLFNAILGRSRAIVTDIPGTTRDALEAVVDSGEWPLRIVDTAGLRLTDDRLERLGIEVSERYLGDAEIVLACGETREDLVETLDVIAAKSRAIVIPVRTKADLVTNRSELDRTAIAVSAETGSGLQELTVAINRVLTDQHGRLTADQPILTRARHRDALTAACSELEAFARTWREAQVPATIAAVHLRSAVSQLEELIGSVQIEDVLDRVFSSFCVGK